MFIRIRSEVVSLSHKVEEACVELRQDLSVEDIELLLDSIPSFTHCRDFLPHPASFL